MAKPIVTRPHQIVAVLLHQGLGFQHRLSQQFNLLCRGLFCHKRGAGLVVLRQQFADFDLTRVIVVAIFIDFIPLRLGLLNPLAFELFQLLNTLGILSSQIDKLLVYCSLAAISVRQKGRAGRPARLNVAPFLLLGRCQEAVWGRANHQAIELNTLCRQRLQLAG